MSLVLLFSLFRYYNPDKMLYQCRPKVAGRRTLPDDYGFSVLRFSNPYNVSTVVSRLSTWYPLIYHMMDLLISFVFENLELIVKKLKLPKLMKNSINISICSKGSQNFLHFDSSLIIILVDDIDQFRPLQAFYRSNSDFDSKKTSSTIMARISMSEF